MVKESQLLCAIFSFFAGLTLILSTACLAYAKKQSEKDVDNFPKKFWVLAYFGNIVLKIGSFGFQYLSIMYGRISLAHPISLSTQLLSNMVIFGAILKYEKIGKDTRVGTYISCVCVTLLMFVGPRVSEEEQDIIAILGEPLPMVLAAVIMGTAVISASYVFFLGCCMQSPLTSENRNFWFLVMNIVSNSLIAASTFKMIPLVNGIALGITIAIAIFSNIDLLYTSMLAAVVIPNQTTFVPTYATGILVLTAITGKIIWKDVIRSEGAYVCVFLLFFLSNYLISTFDLVNHANAAFKYGGAAESVIGNMHRRGSLIANEWKERRGSTLAVHLQHSIILKNLRESMLSVNEGNVEEFEENVNKLEIGKANDGVREKNEDDVGCALPG